MYSKLMGSICLSILVFQSAKSLADKLPLQMEWVCQCSSSELNEKRVGRKMRVKVDRGEWTMSTSDKFPKYWTEFHTRPLNGHFYSDDHKSYYASEITPYGVAYTVADNIRISKMNLHSNTFTYTAINLRYNYSDQTEVDTKHEIYSCIPLGDGY